MRGGSLDATIGLARHQRMLIASCLPTEQAGEVDHRACVNRGVGIWLRSRKTVMGRWGDGLGSRHGRTEIGPNLPAGPANVSEETTVPIGAVGQCSRKMVAIYECVNNFFSVPSVWLRIHKHQHFMSRRSPSFSQVGHGHSVSISLLYTMGACRHM